MLLVGGCMNEKIYEQKVSEINNTRLSSVSLIIVDLLIFITYTVKIVSEYFEPDITFNVGGNRLLDIGIIFLFISILLLILTLFPVMSVSDLDCEKSVQRFNLLHKVQHILYLIGYYLMVLGVYFIVGMILFSIGFTSIPILLTAILLLSIIVFILIKSIVNIVSL